ncbi:transcription factor GTE4-like [Magnolia sinica]|uniref:transcription factor GTE4-like n=1 Tax=Magnolia sinica TaxID=86752 RepID=UPI002659A919|nr:transcription factor GTE4-like [Magnolia sinica]XP_058100712.1 transcription factor GTE4-like [Magnolia sinica]XP_058100713.1 transcription factor GTE4-like [Magnolia sinica]
MASGPLVGGGGGSGDGPSRDKQRWMEHKVYRRKSFNKSRISGPAQQTEPQPSQPQPPSSQTLTPTEEAISPNHHQQEQREQQHHGAASDDSSSLNRLPAPGPTVARDPPPSSNGFLPRLQDNRVTINLASRSKQDLRDLRRQLIRELDQVRSLVRRLESRVPHGYAHSQLSANNAADDSGLAPAAPKRMNSEAMSIKPREPRTFHPLSVSTVPNSDTIIEKEKRTPKANQYYRNSEFLLGKERLPPPDSGKKSKSNGRDYGGSPVDRNLNQAIKNCASLLSKLMKHKHAWVFNSPVDVKGLGLHDYHTIIKHPMDLGTVKSRLSKNWYKSPREFAEDVRLTFQNAMAYNPKGQDVYIMAEQLSELFEQRWAVIEAEYSRRPRFDYLDREVAPPFVTTPHVMKKAPPPPLELTRSLDRSESTTRLIDSKPIAVSFTPTGRVAVPKKPKAKDPNKRDMTYEEKQRLSTNLLSLPPEKLDNIVQIIKKRNSDLSQHDDEIEVDIDSFDVETLWELDRFVTNYKKSLSKNKRKAELAIQAKGEARNNNAQETNPIRAAVEAPKESKITDEKNVASSSPVEGEKPGENASRSSSSSSSSSDSGSSSSDSDSESSSASDAGHSPRT